MHLRGHLYPVHPGSVLGLVIAMLLLAGFISAQQSERDKVDGFAKCLTKKNAAMYGSFLCSHCDDQRKIFGDSFKYIHYVECSQIATSQDANACKSAQIRYTPTWILGDGVRLVGLQTFKELSDKTGCPLP
jgi:protein-disulfide isomerase